jgi:hypothetical protein
LNRVPTNKLANPQRRLAAAGNGCGWRRSACREVRRGSLFGSSIDLVDG